MPNTSKVVEIDQFREKLIDLRQEGERIAYDFCMSRQEGDNCPYNEPDGCQEGMIADHLIANGVTLDNQVASSKWISVKDRLPTEEDAIDGGFVLANTEEKVIIALWSDVFRFNEFVTHWMPLPQPPKGE